MDDDFTLIEKGLPLSQSVIWSSQKRFYQSLGKEAWSQGIVPSQITSNAFIAKQYAQLIYCYISDLKTHDKVTIIELGAGHGKFSYLCMKQLIQLSKQLGMPTGNMQYIMTDYVQANIDFWKQHPALKKMTAQGSLDFALFDACKDNKITLEISQQVIDGDNPRQHTILIANYFFDSLALDFFQINHNKLYSCYPSVSMKKNNDNIRDHPNALFEEIKLDWEMNPVIGDPYDDHQLNAILDKYTDNLDNVIFSVPTHALKTIKSIESFTSDNLFLLSADKGYHQLSQFKSNALASRLTRGYIAFGVNYHLLSEWFQMQQGRSWQSKFENSHLNFSLFTNKKRAYPAVNFYFNQIVESYSPLDFHNLNREKAERTPLPDLRYCISLIRLSNYDPSTFYYLRRAIRNNLSDMRKGEKIALLEILPRVGDFYYKLGTDDDVLYAIGGIYQRLRLFTTAIDYYQQSMKNFGPHHKAYENIGICYYHMGKFDLSTTNFNFSLAVNEDNSSAKRWKRRVANKK